MSSLATGWSWQAMAWAMLPGLMNLKRMSASGGMESRIELVVRRLVGSAAICPAVEAPPTMLLPGLSGFSDQSADDLVEGLGLAGLVVESGAAADQGTADSSKQSPTWRIMHTDYRQPLKTFQETISTVIALHFYATA
jgi:hypothetical protein